MKRILMGFFLWICNYYSFAQNPALHVAIAPFTPPFVFQSTQQFYGFDIATMNYICAKIKRTCHYHPMAFSKLIEAVATGQVDAAISAITMSLDRARYVSFSDPYLPSRSQFLGSGKFKNTPITLDFLQQRKIGVKAGSIFKQQIALIGATNAQVMDFPTEQDIMDALQSEDIDIALLDEYASIYWENHTDGAMVRLGAPYAFGSLGIAVNPAEPGLLYAINQALEDYLNSQEFVNEFSNYLQFF